MGASNAGAAGKTSTDMSGHVFEVSGVSVRFKKTEKELVMDRVFPSG